MRGIKIISKTINYEKKIILTILIASHFISAQVTGCVYGKMDAYTAEQFSICPVAALPNGITAADNIIFFLSGGKYYKRNFTGALNTKWFGAKGDGIKDDSDAIQKAINMAIALEVNLDVSGTCLLKKTIKINGRSYQNSTGVPDKRHLEYFVIKSVDGGGFYTDVAINMFDTDDPHSIGPTNQYVRFQNIVFKTNSTILDAKVLNGDNMFRLSFQACNFNFIKLLTSSRYTQSIYVSDCTIYAPTGTFFESLTRTFDFKFTNNSVETGEKILVMNRPTGCSITGNLFEGESNPSIAYNSATGLSIQGNYFEGNKIAIDGKSLIGSDIYTSRGVVIAGNFFWNPPIPSIDPNDNYSIYWGAVEGAISYGNSGDKLHYLQTDSKVEILDVSSNPSTFVPQPTWLTNIPNPLGLGLVHQTSNETIGGEKTFENIIKAKSDVEISGKLITNGGDIDFRGNKNKIIGNQDPTNYYIAHFPVTNSDGLDIHWFGGIRLGDVNDYRAIQITNGKVGIGTTIPSEKLTVSGRVRATGFVTGVVASGVPDYVFESKYKLRPLVELEAFVKTNKHLPEIESAKDIEKEGLKLDEMSLKLLKKVEELTLYVIEQNKSILNQRKDIEILKKRLIKTKSKPNKNKLNI